jgi:branched-chain amino acid transport system substrate-binding protein
LEPRSVAIFSSHDESLSCCLAVVQAFAAMSVAFSAAARRSSWGSQYTNSFQPSSSHHKGDGTAVGEINSAGGVLGRPLEIVSRATTTAIRETRCASPKADLTRTGETPDGDIRIKRGLAVADLIKQRRCCSRRRTADRQDRLERQSKSVARVDVHADRNAGAQAAKLRKLGDRLSNYEYGQSATDAFETDDFCSRAVSVRQQAVPLGKIEAGSVVRLLDSKPDAIFSSLFGPDLAFRP